MGTRQLYLVNFPNTHSLLVAYKDFFFKKSYLFILFFLLFEKHLGPLVKKGSGKAAFHAIA